MKQEKKDQGTKDKLLKGATAAGVALGGAVMYGQGNVVYAAESTTSTEEIHESELSEVVSEQEVAASETSEVTFVSETTDVSTSEASEVEFNSDAVEPEAVPTRGRGALQSENAPGQVKKNAEVVQTEEDTLTTQQTLAKSTSEVVGDHDDYEHQGEDTDVNYASCIKNSHHVSRVWSGEIEIDGKTYKVKDGVIVARWDPKHWYSIFSYDWNYNFVSSYTTDSPSSVSRTFSAGAEIYKCHGEAYVIRYANDDWVEFRSYSQGGIHVYKYAVAHGNDWDLMDDNSYEVYSESVSTSTSDSIVDSTSLSESSSTSLSESTSTSTSLSDSASTSTSLSDSTSTSTSLSDSTSTSTSLSNSASTSTSLSDSASTSTSLSDSVSTSTSLSDSASTSTSLSDSTSTSTSLSDSASTSTSLSDSASTSTSLSESTSTSTR
ncbi:MAG: hypothetical protein II169_08195 [Lachnospiraceae bacterium]|nr:hypothetical protein [Lachnospiraceae bacterium]